MLKNRPDSLLRSARCSLFVQECPEETTDTRTTRVSQQVNSASEGFMTFCWSTAGLSPQLLSKLAQEPISSLGSIPAARNLHRLQRILSIA